MPPRTTPQNPESPSPQRESSPEAQPSLEAQPTTEAQPLDEAQPFAEGSGFDEAVKTFRLPFYARLWSSNLIQFVCFQILFLAMQWLVVSLTPLRTAVGLVGFVQVGAAAAFSPLAGVIVDREAKRNLIAIGRIGLASIAAVIGLLVFVERVEYWHLLALSVVGGLLFFGLEPGDADLCGGCRRSKSNAACDRSERDGFVLWDDGRRGDCRGARRHGGHGGRFLERFRGSRSSGCSGAHDSDSRGYSARGYSDQCVGGCARGLCVCACAAASAPGFARLFDGNLQWCD